MRAEPEVAKLRRQAQIVRTKQREPDRQRAAPQLSIRRHRHHRELHFCVRAPNDARPRIGRERSHFEFTLCQRVQILGVGHVFGHTPPYPYDDRFNTYHIWL